MVPSAKSPRTQTVWSSSTTSFQRAMRARFIAPTLSNGRSQYQGLRRAVPDAPRNLVVARAAVGASRQSLLADLETMGRFAASATGQPRDVVNFGGLGGVPVVLAAILVLTAWPPWPTRSPPPCSGAAATWPC